MKREYLIKVGDMREGDSFVRWPDEQLGNEREVWVLRDVKPLPTETASMIISKGEIFVLSQRGTWISLTSGIGYESVRFEYENWYPYSKYIYAPVTVDRLYRAISNYADYVSKHNGITWLTEHGRMRFAEEIAKDLKNG